MSRGRSILFLAIVFVVSHSNGQPIQEKRRYLAAERPSSPKIAGETLAGNGTGFFVGKQGWILTCNHVVSRADQLEILMSTGESVLGTIVAKDPEHDLTLLRVQHEAPAVIPILGDQNAALGDEVFTLGFPVPELEGFNPKLTSGTINSLTGARDDPDYLQISAPVQPGNSGGAVISEQGYLVGIVSGRLREGVFLEKTDVLPQNVNYARKASQARTLLENQKVALETTVFPTKKEAINNLEKATALILVYRSSDSSPQTTPNSGARSARFEPGSQQAAAVQEERELTIRRNIREILGDFENPSVSIFGNKIKITLHSSDWHPQQDNLARALACSALLWDEEEANKVADKRVIYQFFHVIIDLSPSDDILGEAIVKRSDYPTSTALRSEQDRSVKAWDKEFKNQASKRIKEILRSN